MAFCDELPQEMLAVEVELVGSGDALGVGRPGFRAFPHFSQGDALAPTIEDTSLGTDANIRPFSRCVRCWRRVVDGVSRSVKLAETAKCVTNQQHQTSQK
jgi:hypothetical protein